MKYYHVVIETKSGKGRRAIFTDLSKSETRKRFVKLYLNDNDLFLDGEILPVGSLTRVRIVSTDRRIEAVLKEVQEKSSKEVQEFNQNSDVVVVSAGWGWNNEEIEDYGEDVTSLFLHTGPGSGTSTTKFISLLNHPWLIRIGSGLLLLIIGGLIGRYIK